MISKMWSPQAFPDSRSRCVPEEPRGRDSSRLLQPQLKGLGGPAGQQEGEGCQEHQAHASRGKNPSQVEITLLYLLCPLKQELRKNGCRWTDKILSRKARLSNTLKDLSDGKTLQFWPWHFFLPKPLHQFFLTLKILTAPNQRLLCLQWHRSGAGESSHSLCQLCRQWTVSWRLQIHPRKLCHLPDEHRQEHNTLTGEWETISSGNLAVVWQCEVTNIIFSLYLWLTVLCL